MVVISPTILLGAILAFAGGLDDAAAASTVGKSYHLYHKLGDDPALAARGVIRIAPSESDGGALAATFNPEDSSRMDVAAFDRMVESNALYTLVVLEEGDEITKPSSSAGHRVHVSASVPGCSLRRSNLREEIGLTVGPTGDLLSVSYRPVISSLAPKTCRKMMPLADRPEAVYGRRGEHEDGSAVAMPFKTTASFDSHRPMMVIPTVLPQQRPPPGLKWYRRNAKNNPTPALGAQREGGIPGVDDEQPSGFKSSFLYRYWYIIVPLAIMGLFGGVDEEELEKQQQAGRAGGAASAGASSGAAAAGRGAQTRQRRGKRD